MTHVEAIRSLHDLGAIIRRHRRLRKLTQAELASRAAVAPKQISRLENAAMEPKLSTIVAVLAALDLEIGASRVDQEGLSMEDIF